MASHNFIGNGEEVSADGIYKRDLKPEQIAKHNLEPRKREVIKENKAKMLEKIMSKTFSHGGVNQITEIWLINLVGLYFLYKRLLILVISA